MRKKLVNILLISIFIVFSSLGRRDSSFHCLSLSLRRQKVTVSLSTRIKPKLELIKLTLSNQEINQAKQLFKNNPDELNKLADKLSNPKIKNSLELTDSELKQLQNILRNYTQYSSSQIEKETGFSKLAFPALLHLWIEKGPFYKGKTTVIFTGHRNKADFEIVKMEWEKLIQEAEERGMEVVFVFEDLPLVEEDLDFFYEVLGDPYSIFKGHKLDSYLQEYLKKNCEKLQEITSYLLKGEFPPNYVLPPKFQFETHKFVAEQKREVIFEKVSLQALKEEWLSRFAKAEAFGCLFEKGDLETYMNKMWLSFIHTSNAYKLRDMDFQELIEKLSKPNRYILSYRGCRHLIRARETEGYIIEEKRPENFPVEPEDLLVKKLMTGEPISEETKREMLLRNIIWFLGYELLKKSTPEIGSKRLWDILDSIAQRWTEEETLLLVDNFKQKGKEAGFEYFLNWIKNSSLPREIKNLFPQ